MSERFECAGIPVALQVGVTHDINRGRGAQIIYPYPGMATSIPESHSTTQTEDTNPTKHPRPSYSQQPTEIRRIVDTTELKEGDSW